MHPLTRLEETRLADAILGEPRDLATDALAKIRRAIAGLEELGIAYDHPHAIALAGAVEKLEELLEVLP
jgi:hypothetical protein